ncbi:FAD/NAD(P)-binding protein [Streptomyces sp. AV19]|uniref:FAD/NAD(P)-binding protein n=1 Tax=Streptomyces sp. AV19 TaxID=2793068 RepID=UPI0018FEA2D1|nr:FAD/NAD(P)-binding protein [Streptomyces sp. AV19]MBH1934518.1 FAD/NAD(P)-binding protein [Streptomyces sp. AV19]MDG4533312.1 FAD/NAD(P)-binding protein [Streptomyces sp. AV19]
MTERVVVIVGAGVAGTGVLWHLVDALRGAPGRPVGSIVVADPSPAGWGLAFGDDDPLLMCNSAADANSLLPDRPDDFVEYLRGRGWTGKPDACVPRARMAEYCQDLWTRARDLAGERGVAVRHVRAAVRAIRPGVRPVVELGTGERITADDVVVATGVHRPRVPDGFAEFTAHPRYLDSPYPAARLRAELGTGRRVLVLGSRQSAVDAALLLSRDGHRTTMASPSGTLPSVRISLHAPARAFPPLERLARLDPADPLLAERMTRCVVEAVRLLGNTPLRRQTSRAADPVRRLAEETALAEAGTCQWPGVAMAAMEAFTAFADGLPLERRKALMARFDWFTGRYVTALAAVNARRLLGHLESGAVELAPAYPRSVSFRDGLWRVEWPGSAPSVPSAPSTPSTPSTPESFDYVVNATGFHPPELWWADGGAELRLAPHGSATVGHLAPDLRVRRAPGTAPERIRVAGVGTHPRIPFSNHLRTVARQTRAVARQVAEGGGFESL